MAAAIGGHTEVVNALLLAGAPWNAIDRKLRCAGDLALEHDQMDAARALLEAGGRRTLLHSWDITLQNINYTQYGQYMHMAK
jgi:protein arginine N-methyltransferase 2